MASATGSDHTPSSSPNPGSSDDNSRTNLIINYLPQNLTESELFKMFVTIGTVTNCKIMRDFRVNKITLFVFLHNIHFLTIISTSCLQLFLYRRVTVTVSVSSITKNKTMPFEPSKRSTDFRFRTSVLRYLTLDLRAKIEKKQISMLPIFPGLFV